MIAFCGVNCAECGAYIATKAGDDDKKAEVAREWSQKFGAEIQPEVINCMGCSSSGPVFFYCAMCDIRKCTMERKLPNCAHCEDYACEKLEAFFEMSPENREWLEKIRDGR